MSQTSRFTRARQLTSTVLPGRRPDGYADQVTGRLRRIAAARSTGMLPFSGRSDGSHAFTSGTANGTAYAESTRTPGPAPHDQLTPDQPPLNKITAILAITEPTVDAALELLSVQSRYAKFRPSRVPDTGPASNISLDALLAEVARRQRVLGQLSVVLTADTALARNPHIRPDAIRVSALQWALLIRVRHGSTPRDLAWDLSRSVFGTTVEAYRLLARRLLSVAGPRPDDPGEAPAWPPCRSSGRCPSRKVRQCPSSTLRLLREVPPGAAPGRTRPPGSGGRRTRSRRTARGHRSRPNLGPNGRHQSRTRRPTVPG